VVQIIPIADADFEAAGAAMGRAFWNDPLMGRALPDEAERAARSGPLFSNALRYSKLVGVAYVPAGIPAGAACGWKLPRPELPHERFAEAGLRPSDEVLGVDANKRFSTITKYVDEHMFRLVPPPCWYLAALAVDPAYQNQGIGGALVRAFMDLAAADGLPLCLWTANPANVNFYFGLDLDVVGEGIEPSNDLPYWIFKR
jgi:GNAT superfamily N-acetyltransferase